MEIDIFYIEGSHGQVYRHQLEERGFTAQCVFDGKEVLIGLKELSISHGVLLNAYSMNTSGVRIVRRSNTHTFCCRWFISLMGFLPQKRLPMWCWIRSPR